MQTMMTCPIGAVFISWMFLLSCVRVGEADTHYPHPKVWWAKKIASHLYTAGLLTERQIKYAGEAGFKSIISMYEMVNNSSRGRETEPTSAVARYIANSFLNITYRFILSPGTNWRSSEVVLKSYDVISRAPKPVLFHCFSATSSSFHAIGTLAVATKRHPGFRPHVTSKEWFKMAADLGINFADDEILLQVVSNITGEPIVEDPARPHVSIPNPQTIFREVLPVYYNYYITGQITRAMVENLKQFPVTHVFNLRQGPEVDGTREEVTLINVADNTGEGRQTPEVLQNNLLNSDLPGAYVDWPSDVNYESRNPLEFGDDVGYNGNQMQQVFESELPNIEYRHTPVAPDRMSIDDWNRFETHWRRNRGDHVLFISRMGVRAVTMAVLAAAKQEGYDDEWALKRAAQMGFDLEQTRPDAVSLIRHVLSRPVSGQQMLYYSNVLSGINLVFIYMLTT